MLLPVLSAACDTAAELGIMGAEPVGAAVAVGRSGATVSAAPRLKNAVVVGRSGSTAAKPQLPLTIAQ